MSARRRIAVLGAGPMGLGAAYELAKAGHEVVVFERDDRIGGMSASFDFNGLTLERYYHFVCAPDTTLFEYLREFGLEERLKWVETTMGFYYAGRLHEWGNPWALLRFPHLDLVSKFRYGLHVLWAKRQRDWAALDRVEATAWLRRWIGERAYDVLWRSLFDLKFYEHAESLSAAWLCTRIKRVALSRRNAFVERLGYLEGGSQSLLAALDARIHALGGRIRLSSGVDEISIEAGAVRGVRVAGVLEPFDTVVSTIPLPYLVRLAPGLPGDEAAKVRAIVNIGVACAVVKLDRRLTRNFWTNVNDPAIPIPGIIEYTNLNPLARTVVYAPFYMPVTNPRYRAPKEELLAHVHRAMAALNPAFDPSWILDEAVFRYEFAQTVCTPGFFAKLPPKASAVRGLFLADTSHYYPEDRSISESLRLGRELAGLADGRAR